MASTTTLLTTEQRTAVLRLARKHGVTNVRVFGSFARGDATAESDIDLLVEGLENAAWGGGRLQVELEQLLNRRVDLVSEGDLYAPIRERVLREAVPL